MTVPGSIREFVARFTPRRDEDGDSATEKPHRSSRATSPPSKLTSQPSEVLGAAREGTSHDSHRPSNALDATLHGRNAFSTARRSICKPCQGLRWAGAGSRAALERVCSPGHLLCARAKGHHTSAKSTLSGCGPVCSTATVARSRANLLRREVVMDGSSRKATRRCAQSRRTLCSAPCSAERTDRTACKASFLRETRFHPVSRALTLPAPSPERAAN